MLHAIGGTVVQYGRCYNHLADVIAKGWNGLADVIGNVADDIATGSCLLQFKFCDDVQNLIPYMRQMVFAYVVV